MTPRQIAIANKHLRDAQRLADDLPRGKRNKIKNKISKVITIINKQKQ